MAFVALGLSDSSQRLWRTSEGVGDQCSIDQTRLMNWWSRRLGSSGAEAAVNEAGVTRFALEMLIRYRAARLALDVDKLGAALSTIIDHHARLLHSSEVAWALWGANRVQAASR